jgi:hypothetical protein
MERIMMDKQDGFPSELQWTMTHPQCKVCTSPDRFEIEVALAEGQAQQAVARRFSRDGQTYNKQNIHTHYRSHMPVIERAIADAAAARMQGKRLDIGTVLEIEDRNERNRAMMRQQVAEQIESNALRWSARDAMRFLELDAQLGEQRSAALMEEFMADARAFSEAVKKVVPQTMWQDIVDEFDLRASGRTDDVYRPEESTLDEEGEA